MDDFWYFDVGAGWTIILVLNFIFTTISVFRKNK